MIRVKNTAFAAFVAVAVAAASYVLTGCSNSPALPNSYTTSVDIGEVQVPSEISSSYKRCAADKTIWYKPDYSTMATYYPGFSNKFFSWNGSMALWVPYSVTEPIDPVWKVGKIDEMNKLMASHGCDSPPEQAQGPPLKPDVAQPSAPSAAPVIVSPGSERILRTLPGIAQCAADPEIWFTPDYQYMGKEMPHMYKDLILIDGSRTVFSPVADGYTFMQPWINQAVAEMREHRANRDCGSPPLQAQRPQPTGPSIAPR